MTENTVPADIIDRALETYDLELSMGGLNRDALTQAILAAVLAHEQQVIVRLAGVLEALGQDCDDEYNTPAATLGWAAEQVLKYVTPTAGEAGLYLPQQDDILEVVLAGRVHIAQDTCDHCGHNSQALWSLYDFATGAEYFFDEAEIKGKLRARVLHRADDSNEA